MNWRDLLYFSKGERRALALLLCLITISWILLLWTNTKRMPIEAQTDAHRTENRQAPGERRIITGKNTSEGGKNFIRKESGPHPNKTKNTLKDKSPTLTGNNSYPTGKKRKGYTLYTRTEKYAPGTLVELNTADTTILKKVPGIGSTFARRIMKYRELLGETTIAENREEGSFIWDNYFDEEEQINEYDLTLFIREEEGLYRRFEETHYQRAYELETVKHLLEQAGLEFVAAYDAFTREPVKEDSERIYVIARSNQET